MKLDTILFPKLFFLISEMFVNITKVVCLKRFVGKLKKRLDKIHSRKDYCCDKLIQKKKFTYYGPEGIYRCGGCIGKFGCYNCDPTGFECKECGEDVSSEKEFCSGYCRYKYFGL